MNKIVFFDIDGTLFYPGIGIPKSAIQSVKQLIANGHKAILCTGRAMGMIPEEYMDLGFHGMIAGAGTHIICEGIELQNQVVDQRDVKTAIAWGKENGFGIVLEGSEAGYYDEEMLDVPEYKQVIEHLLRDTTPRNYPLQHGFTKVNKWTYHQMSQEKALDIEKKIDFRLKGIYHEGAHSVEFVPENVSKATGAKKVLDYFGMNQKDSYAFGDSDNDIALIEFVEYGTAMENSSSRLLEVAKYQTAAAYEDGIEKGLKFFGLI